MDSMAAPLPLPALERLVAALIAAELNAGGRRLNGAEVARWDGGQRLDAEGLALDSLELLACGAAVNAFFHLHESGIEDMLLLERTIAGWAGLVYRAQQEGFARLTFNTSGSTGTPKPCTHDIATLEDEVAFFAGRFAGRGRVVALVPPHHIYGFLFTVLLPRRLGVPLLDARGLSAGALRRALRGDDLLVAHPTSLLVLQRSLGGLPNGLLVTSSTAPLPATLHAAMRAMGAAEVMEIYGSSETAGIATRTTAEGPFHLLPRWCAGGVEEEASVVERATGREFPLPDRATWPAARALHLHGRKDEAVQVGGVNIFPRALEARLRALPGVADCALRLDTSLPEPRLKAFLVPAQPAQGAALVAEVEAHCRSHWSAPERPVRIAHGPALPRNAMGKPRDWNRDEEDVALEGVFTNSRDAAA